MTQNAIFEGLSTLRNFLKHFSYLAARGPRDATKPRDTTISFEINVCTDDIRIDDLEIVFEIHSFCCQYLLKVIIQVKSSIG